MAYNIINKRKGDIKMKTILDKINKALELEDEEMGIALDIVEIELKERYNKKELEKMLDFKDEIPTDAQLILAGMVEQILN